MRSDPPPPLGVFSRHWWSRRRLAFAAIAFLAAAATAVFVVWALAPLDHAKNAPRPNGTDPLSVHLRELQDSVVP